MTQTSNTTSKKCLLRDKRSAAASAAKYQSYMLTCGKFYGPLNLHGLSAATGQVPCNK